jgi:hypothetical protein
MDPNIDAKELPARPNLEQYRKQAKDLVKARRANDPAAISHIKEHHPRLGKLSDEEIRTASFALADAQLIIAREYGFESWPKFAKHIEALTRANSPVSKFEAAVDAVITGDLVALKSLLHENPQLIQERSTRVHRATLLHYVSANGVEGYRQKTPRNAVEVARLLLEAGAEVNATAGMYGGGAKTLGLVATSFHPAKAGVQIPLMETLLQAGAELDDAPGRSTVNGALANGRPGAAHFLARRGAFLDLEGAAGIGRLEMVQSFFNKEGGLKSPATKTQLVSCGLASMVKPASSNFSWTRASMSPRWWAE